MDEYLIGWRALGELSGKRPEALRQADRRGTLPLAKRWSEGRRAFDVAEVRTWLERENRTQKPN